MRPGILFASAVASIVVAAGAASAFEEGYGGRHGGHGAFGHGPVAPMMKVLGELELSDAQLSQIMTVVETRTPQLRNLHRQGRELRRDLHETVPDDPAYYDVVAVVAQQSGQLVMRLVEETAQLRAELYAVLTPEQKAEAAQIRAEFDQRRQRFEDHLNGLGAPAS